jgi:phenylacetic acid degradation operon negative regulatory protein
MNTIDIIFGLMLSLGKKEYSFEDLKYLTSPFKIKNTTLRTNLSRLKNSGRLNISKIGKKAVYSASDKMKIISKNVSLSFKGINWDKWDNRWIGAAFSVPDSQKAFRHKIRKKLSAYRFAALYPGFWIRPYNKKENLQKYLNNLTENGFCTFIIFNCTEELKKETTNRIWKLNKINKEFINILKILLKEEKQINAISPVNALKRKIITGNKIVPVLFKDPLLPQSLLPDNWKGQELREKFLNWDKKISEVSKSYWIMIFK